MTGLAPMIAGVAMTIAGRILPALPEKSYVQGDAKLATAILLACAQDADRAADRLVRENRALRALFREASAAALPENLAARLADAAAGEDDSLVVPALGALNDRLMALLVELHAIADDNADAWGKALSQRIWALLRQSAEGRMIVLPDL